MRQRRRGAFGGRARGDGPYPARAVRAGVSGTAAGIPGATGIPGAAARISAAAGGSPAASCVGFSLVVVRVPLGTAVVRLAAPAPATTAAGLLGLGAASRLQRAEASQPVVQRQFDEQLEQQQ